MSTAHITAEDVLQPGSRWRDHEIWDGLPLLREPSGGQAEAIGARLMARLTMHVADRDAGWTFQSSQGFLLRRDPDLLLAPDGAYVARRRLSAVPAAGFIETAPDLVLEIRSPADSWEAVVEKGTIWVLHGTAVAWCIDPLERRIAVLRPARPPRLLEPGDAADGAPVLPDFVVPMDDVFRGFDP